MLHNKGLDPSDNQEVQEYQKLKLGKNCPEGCKIDIVQVKEA